MAADPLAPTDGLPVDYPADLEADEHTVDGVLVRLRPIRPGDGAALMDFHEHLSDQSVFRRYFCLHPHLSAREIEHLTVVDYRDRLALVVMDAARLVAVGRYERLPGTEEAEVAFVVADAYQRRGIGTLLLHHLADAARERGIREFVAETQADNRVMIDVFLHSGFPSESTTEWGTVGIRLPIHSVG